MRERLLWAAPLGRAVLTVVVLVLVLILTLAAFGLPVIDSLGLIYEGALGDRFGIARTLVKATPLLLTGLGMIVAWRAGMYNIGGEGQFVIGGVLGAWAAALASPVLPPLLLTLSVVGVCICGGSLWALIAAWLQVKRGVEVVISTILLNFVAIQVLGWSVTGPLQEQQRRIPQSQLLSEAVMFVKLDRQLDLHAGVLLAAVAVIVVQILLFRTVAGYKLRLAGDSPRVARANRIDAKATQVQAMLVSGGLCGLAAAVEYLGTQGQISTGFAQGWGFLGIPVALLSGLNPVLAVFSAAYFGALFAGSENLGRFTASGPTLIFVIQAAALLVFVAFRAVAERRAYRPGAA